MSRTLAKGTTVASKVTVDEPLHRRMTYQIKSPARPRPYLSPLRVEVSHMSAARGAKAVFTHVRILDEFYFPRNSRRGFVPFIFHGRKVHGRKEEKKRERSKQLVRSIKKRRSCIPQDTKKLEIRNFRIREILECASTFSPSLPPSRPLLLALFGAFDCFFVGLSASHRQLSGCLASATSFPLVYIDDNLL